MTAARYATHLATPFCVLLCDYVFVYNCRLFLVKEECGAFEFSQTRCHPEHRLLNAVNMASGGFKPNAATDFLEEWKAKREKMRAKMLGDIAAITSANSITTSSSSAKVPETRSVPDLNNSNGNPERSGSMPHTMARSASSSALPRRADEEVHVHAVQPQPPTPVPRGSDTKKSTEKLVEPDSASPCPDSDLESPKGKEKKSSGPSARKGKGQIEKRKLREKRRSTGVVSIPSNEVRAETQAAALRFGMKCQDGL